MEGRFPNGILFVMSNCSDPSKEDEFNDWYTNIHLPRRHRNRHLQERHTLHESHRQGYRR